MTSRFENLPQMANQQDIEAFNKLLESKTVPLTSLEFYKKHSRALTYLLEGDYFCLNHMETNRKGTKHHMTCVLTIDDFVLQETQ